MSSHSLTKITTYEKCALKYKFRYIDLLPEERNKAAQGGVDTHKLVEDCIVLGTSLPDQYSHYFGWLQSLRGENAFPEHKICVNRNWEPVGWESEDAYIRSILDLKYVVGPKELAVYDWKTGKIYDDHDDQKRLYAAMVFVEHPEVLQVRSIHVYLDLGKNVERIFHRDQFPQLRGEWDQRIASLEAEVDWIPSPGYHCRWCSRSKLMGGPCRF